MEWRHCLKRPSSALPGDPTSIVSGLSKHSESHGVGFGRGLFYDWLRGYQLQSAGLLQSKDTNKKGCKRKDLYRLRVHMFSLQFLLNDSQLNTSSSSCCVLIIVHFVLVFAYASMSTFRFTPLPSFYRGMIFKHCSIKILRGFIQNLHVYEALLDTNILMDCLCFFDIIFWLIRASPLTSRLFQISVWIMLLV